MKFIKMNNLSDSFGQPNYKGLDIEKFIAGSQLYSSSFQEFYCATNEETIPEHADITEITEQEYLAKRQEFIDARQSDQQTTEQKIIGLETQNAQIILAMVQGGMM